MQLVTCPALCVCGHVLQLLACGWWAPLGGVQCEDVGPVLHTRQAHKHLSVKPAWAPQGRVNVVWPAGQQVVRGEGCSGSGSAVGLGWGSACRGIVQGAVTVVRQAQERRCGGMTAACSTAGLFLQGRLCVADCACWELGRCGMWAKGPNPWSACTLPQTLNVS